MNKILNAWLRDLALSYLYSWGIVFWLNVLSLIKYQEIEGWQEYMAVIVGCVLAYTRKESVLNDRDLWQK